MFSLLDTLFSDPLLFLEQALYRIPAVLIALVFHEVAHGYVAYRLGDPTAKSMGRLSLNPLKHLDPVGTLMLFFVGFGWAKPVPVNPRYFKHPHRDDFFVSIAGITVNFLLFLLFTIALVILNQFLWQPDILENYTLHGLMSWKGSLNNIILNGDSAYIAMNFQRPGLIWAARLCGQIAYVNLGIAVFNLLPIPPLDGSHVINDLLFKGKLFASQKVATIGSLLMVVLLVSGVLGNILSFVTTGIQSGVLTVIEAVMGVF